MKLVPLAIAVALVGCNSSDDEVESPPQYVQPELSSRHKPIIDVDGYKFRDMKSDGVLHPFEDWRLSPEERAADLVSRMSNVEKAGMLMIDTLNSGKLGEPTELADRYIYTEKMNRFIFRNPVVDEPNPDIDGGRSGPELTAREAAEFTNAIQEMAEQTRLGIPALFKSNARNHIDPNAKPGINVSAGSFSDWPKEAGLAAIRDMDLIAEFAEIMNQEWSSIGLRSMYGYMMDLATEPRWYRVHETFTEDADLASDIMYSLIKGLQGDSISQDSVALTIKHFPGGGPQLGGGDPHYDFGKDQTYPSDNFDYHLKPFQAAIDAGATSIMPYYGIPVDQRVEPNDVGMSFSKGVVTDLLRDEMGFTGYVNSDTGIMSMTPWGVEHLTEEERMAMSIEAGVDVVSGYNNNALILYLMESGLLTEERVNLSVQRLLEEQFKLGLFENPYVNPDVAQATVGKPEFKEKALDAQRRSVILLQNSSQMLPLVTPADDKPVNLYTMGMDLSIVTDPTWGYEAVNGDYDAETGESRPEVPANTDYAIIRVRVDNEGADPELFFGGANPDELDLLAFSDMATAKSWNVMPSLEDIKDVMQEAGPENTILSINFRQPFVLDEASGMREAGALLATFGVSDTALMDVLSGKHKPEGKLPFALADSAKAILDQASDAPGYNEDDTLFPFGHGLSYE